MKTIHELLAQTEKPTVPEVLPLVQEFFTKKGNSMGGVLHIVLCDSNTDNSSVEYCLAQAKEQGDIDGILLARLLLKMTRTQRLKLGRLHGYPDTTKGTEALWQNLS